MSLCPHLSSEIPRRLCSPKSILKDNKSKKGLCPHLSSEIPRRLCSPKIILKDNKSKKGPLSPPQFWNTQETVFSQKYFRGQQEQKGGSVTTSVLKYPGDCSPKSILKDNKSKKGLCSHLSSEIPKRLLCKPILKDNRNKEGALSLPQIWNTHETVTLTYFKDNMSENGALSPPQFWNIHEILNLTYFEKQQD